jgi:hypothetical protein
MVATNIHDLLPCPFCVGEAELRSFLPAQPDDDQEMYYVSCKKHNSVFTKPYPTRDLAIAEWNNRPTEGLLLADLGAAAKEADTARDTIRILRNALMIIRKRCDVGREGEKVINLALSGIAYQDDEND